MTSVAPPVFKPFTLMLIQLGSIASDKAANLHHAHKMIMKAAKSNSDKRPQVVESFNSPYGFVHFPAYAENISYTAGKEYDIQASVSESVKMLSFAAKEAGNWLIGGSIPERDLETNNIYNTCTVANDNQVFFSMCSPARDITAAYHSWGHSMVVDSYGRVLVEADENETILRVDIDPELFYEVRAGIPVTKQRHFDVYPYIRKPGFSLI
ncbi:carbon-nitrogen hydrolase [Suillus tomentosus]|nr:carbon-nitrogen hydrolase [Suillus tomentosus]